MQIINCEDIKKNNVITVLKWIASDDKSYVGEIFNVRCVDLPFIIVRRSRRNSFLSRTLTLDTRKVVLGKPSEEHIKLVRPAVA